MNSGNLMALCWLSHCSTRVLPKVWWPFTPLMATETTARQTIAMGLCMGLPSQMTGKEKAIHHTIFDGQDDYISVANHSSLNPTGDFAISLWTLVASTQVPHEGINDILRKWNGNAEGYPFSISYLNTTADPIVDKILYARYDGQGCANAPTAYSPTIDNDEFIHIALVKQGTKLRHYLNGELIQEFTDNTSCSYCKHRGYDHWMPWKSCKILQRKNRRHPDIQPFDLRCRSGKLVRRVELHPGQDIDNSFCSP